MKYYMNEMRWPEFAARKDDIIILPVGSTEQHAQHLPPARRFGRALPADFRETHRARARARFMEGFDAVPGAPAFLDAMGSMPRAIASMSRPARPPT